MLKHLTVNGGNNLRSSLLILLFVCPVFSAPPDYCITVVCEDTRGGLSVGSGTVLPGNTVLTARHVLDRPKKVWVIKDGKLVAGSNPVLSMTDDIAKFTCVTGIDPAVIGTVSPSKNDRVVHFGKSTGKSTGCILPYIRILEDNTLIQRSDMLCVPGDSGAGVFNDRSELIAVLTSVDWEHKEQLGVPLSVIKEFLK